MITERPYQTEAVNSVWNYFMAHQGNPVVAMPTGTGKSIVLARLLHSILAAYPSQRIMLLTHVKELIQQNYDKLLQVWPFAPAGIYSAGLNQRVHHQPITLAGIASVAKKWALFGHVDLVLIDEAHLVSPNDTTMYRTFLSGLLSINPNLKIIAFTATPWRLGHGHITDPYIKNDKEQPSLFTDVCFDITGLEPFNRLIQEGYLIPLIPKRTVTKLSVDGVHMRGGEFIEKELQTAVDKDELTYAALQEAMEIGHDRQKWLIFASGTDHADHIGEMLNGLGVPTGIVHSKREGRDRTLKDFREGRIRAVVNNNVLTTGFDDPEIDLIICLRPTASTVLWIQMLGRGTRPIYESGFDLDTIEGRLASIQASQKRNCLVLDYAGNTRRLGPVNDPVIPKRPGEKVGGEAPVKACEVCGCYNHASVRFCSGITVTGELCGAEFKFDNHLNQGASTEALIKADLPVVEIFKIDYVTVDRHEKLGAPPMIKMSYYSNIRQFNEYICIEHKNFAGKKAQQWWRSRTGESMPQTTAEALMLIGDLPVPTHMRVWVNKKYPEILAFCFDGTAFGTQENQGDVPELNVTAAPSRNPLLTSPAPAYDNDIPF